MEMPPMSPRTPLFSRTFHSRDRYRTSRRMTGSENWNWRPRLESLEERTLLNIDMVANSNDACAESLRDTIANASAGDTIEFDMSPGHEARLTRRLQCARRGRT